MASQSKILEEVLRDLLGTSNLPSRYPDFEALTRDLVRKLAPKLVIIDRASWNEILRPKSEPGLTAATERFKAHNDRLEASMGRRDSVPPTYHVPLLHTEELTQPVKKR